MKKDLIGLVAALCLGFTASAFAADTTAMSKDAHKAAKEKIEAQHKTDKKACDAMNGNAKDLCKAEAKGKEKVAKAELEAQYKADKAACDPMKANAKDVCKAEAKGKEKVAKAELDAQNKPGARMAAQAAHGCCGCTAAKRRRPSASSTGKSGSVIAALCASATP